MWKKSLFLGIASWLITVTLHASTTLAPGDLAITGFNTDNNDSFAFVLLKDVDDSTEIKFTENGWKADNTFRTGEGTVTWTSGTAFTAGTVVSVDANAKTATKGSVTTSGSIGFSGSGDVLIAYQGDSSPTPIFAVQMAKSAWDSDSTSTTESALPQGLSDGSTALVVNYDNGKYTGSVTSGSAADILAAVANNGNWTGSNSERYTFDDQAFAIGGGSLISCSVTSTSPVSTLSTDFQSGSLSPWSGCSIASDKEWYLDTYSGSSYAKISGYGGDEASNDWMISPAISFGDDTTFSFRSAMNYSGSTIIVKISTNFSGSGDPTSATWTEITGITWSSGSWAWTDSGSIDLSAYAGSTGYIAFQYTSTGTGSGEAATWEIDDISIASSSGSGSSSSSSATVTKIHDIQTSGSAVAAGNYTVKAIVTGVFSGLSGYFIQEEDIDADSDLSTSEGIFVYDKTNTPSVGDLIQINATAQDYNNLSELTNVSAYSVISSGNSLPTATTLTLPMTSGTLIDVDSDTKVSDAWEAYEGMLVTVKSAVLDEKLTVTEVYNLGRYGTFMLSSGGKLRQFTDTNLPNSSGYTTHQESNARRLITVDDGLSSQNPDPISILACNELAMDKTFRAGFTVDEVTGPLHYNQYDGYMVEPTECITITPETQTNARTDKPDDVGGTLKVSSFNVLNYFTTLNDGTKTIQGEEPRGANSAEEFTRQKEKIANAMASIDADVFGIMEMENNGFGSDSALADLVNAINAVAGSDTYTYIGKDGAGLTGDAITPVSGETTIGGDVIKVSIIYKPSTATPVGDAIAKELEWNDKNRPSIIQRFQEISSGKTFTLVVNHLKSKGSSCDSSPYNDPDKNDGQGNCAGVRTDAVNSLVSYLEDNDIDSDGRYLAIGDLNSYAKEDPVMAFINNGFTDIYTKFLGQEGYTSYGFKGEWGYLDHALASENLIDAVTGVDDWHINADEPSVLSYDVEYKSTNQQSLFYSNEPYRASDHDPVVIGLDLSRLGSGTSDTTPPDISDYSPKDTQVAVNKNITVTFTESIKSSTVNSSSFIVKIADGDTVSGEYKTSGNTVEFDPTSNLQSSTEYQVTVTTAVTDQAGNALAQERQWTFTTISGSTTDDKAPVIEKSTPESNATNVDINSKITVLFSEDINTQNNGRDDVEVKEKENGTTVSGSVTTSGKTLTFTPSTNLKSSTVYEVTIKKTIEDLAGNEMDESVTWTFTTGSGEDDTAPSVVSKFPVDGATNVKLDADITIMFSEAMDTENLSSQLIYVISESGDQVKGSITNDGNIYLFTPDSPLDPETTYHVTLSTEAKDLAGNNLGEAITWSFTTAEATIVPVTFKSGWFLGALPIVTKDFDTTLLLENGVTAVFGYRNGQWDRDPIRMVSGRGYWLFLKYDITLKFPGAAYTPDFDSLDDKWNMLGTGETIEAPATTYGLSTVWSYDPDTGWEKNPAYIYPGEGFWAKP